MIANSICHFPDVDISMNKHLLEDPVEFDFSTIGY